MVDDADDVWRLDITNTGDATVVGLGLHEPRPPGAEGYVRPLLDPSPLLPRQSRTATVHWDGVPSPDRALLLDAWNLTPRTLRPGAPS
jgi:hypothetical protein